MIRRIILTLIPIAILLVVGCMILQSFRQSIESVASHASPPGAKGTLQVSFFTHSNQTAHPMRHQSAWVNGVGYQGMEDNDIRGFLDGRFRFGWNQPGQIHVRAGRRNRSPSYGEYELFRILQRWDSINFPPDVNILDARIRITLEKDVPRETRVLLYNVHKDWNPGLGGTLHNNVSPPNEGEVWWNDTAWPAFPWGLPGVSLASDSDPQADTNEMSLAEAVLMPGDRVLEFASIDLAGYIGDRVNKAQPLLFLVKLDDFSEDLPGSMITLYSGNHGDNRNVNRRPHLILDWESTCETFNFKKKIHLEYGRRYLLDDFPAQPAEWIAATFLSEAEYDPPMLEISWETPDGRSDRRLLIHPYPLEAPLKHLRLTAAVDPVTLGSIFYTELRDTWILTAPPEEQEVLWTFISPQGKKYTVEAQYRGENRWTVEFLPRELGPWHYHWIQNFAETPYLSDEGRFDVIPGTSSDIRAHLEGLAHEIAGLDFKDDSVKRDEYMIHFMRLERAAMQAESAESFHGESGRSLLELLNTVRAQLGAAAPDSIPMRPNAPVQY